MARDKFLAEWFWVDRWMGSSAFLLSIELRGLYREMLSQAWLREARLPNNHEAIRRVTGCTAEEWNRCWPHIERYWHVDGPFLVNLTQIEIYRETIDLSAKRSQAGKQGAEARWHRNSKPHGKINGKTVTKQPSPGYVMANGMAKPCPPSPSPSPSPIPVSVSKAHVRKARKVI